jgi:integrase
MASIRKISSSRTGKITWQVDYKDVEGKRRGKNFKTKKEADRWMTATAYEVANGVHTPDGSSITIADAGSLWIARVERSGREFSTIQQYQTHLKFHILPIIGGAKLSRLSAPKVEGFVDTLAETRTPAMVKKVLTSLRSLIGEAQRRGLVSQNVASNVKCPVSSRDRSDITIPTKDDIRKFIGAVSGRWRPYFVLAIFSGMRASELRGLTWKNVDFEKNIIKVCQRADKWNEIGPPKSKAGRRDIPMAPIVIDELKTWRSKCPKSELDIVFPNGRGNVEALANIYNRGFVPLMRECGLVGEDEKPIFSPHAFRHAAASLFIEQGWTPKRVQVIMGHSGIAITFDTYGHLFYDADDDRYAMAQIQESLLNA